MKKSILSIVLLLTVLACSAQLQSIITTRPGADNLKSGGIKINSNFTFVDSRIDSVNQQLANIDVKISDTTDLYTEIAALPVIQLPVLTQTQINALTPATGMFVFNSTTGKINYYSTGAWRSLAIE